MTLYKQLIFSPTPLLVTHNPFRHAPVNISESTRNGLIDDDLREVEKTKIHEMERVEEKCDRGASPNRTFWPGRQ